MRKIILSSISAAALLALAACDGGSQTPQSGGTDQTGTVETTPAPAEPGGTDTAQ